MMPEQEHSTVAAIDGHGGAQAGAEYAKALALTGNWEEARQRYREALEAAAEVSQQAIILNDMAAMEATVGNLSEARGLLKKALALDLNCRAALDNQRTLDLPLSPAHGHQRGDLTRSVERVAVVSAMFNWPSSGGGNVHTTQLVQALRNAGVEVTHVFLHYEPWSIGIVENNPIDSQPLDFVEGSWSLAEIQSRVRGAIRELSPTVVLLTDCWNLKPWLAGAIRDVPYLLRFDAMECLCPLNNLRVIPHADQYLEPCSKHRLATPKHCVECVTTHGQFIGQRHRWDRQLSEFDSDSYHAQLLWSLSNAHAVLVTNPLIAAALEPYAANVRVVPVGVDATTFGAIASLDLRGEHSDGNRRIFFGGRTDDPVKGFPLLLAACEKLWRNRKDFRVIATGLPMSGGSPFVEWRDWQAHADMPELMGHADIVAAPAVASEPFGLTVVEAMAAARPVVASRVGGQQFTVIDELTGLLFRPDDANDLAAKLSSLLADADLRVAMGNAGRRRFKAEYSWETVIERDYRPLIGAARRRHHYAEH